VPAHDEDGPTVISGAIESLRGIQEGDGDAIVRGIEAVMEAHADAGVPVPGDVVSQEALVLYVLANERSLAEYEDISVPHDLLPEYEPEPDPS
jgi:hypothetical protein